MCANFVQKKRTKVKMRTSLPRAGYFVLNEKCTDGNHGSKKKKKEKKKKRVLK